MIALEILGWSTVSATGAWCLTRWRATALIYRLRAEMREEIRLAHAETTRARTHAAQLSRELASWTEGCRQGREDVMNLMPLLLARSGQEATVSPATEMQARS
jgi:hypothetical protein